MAGHYILKLNNKCNMNCLFCADSSIIRQQPDLKSEYILKSLSEKRKRFNSLIITGGEPTIYNNLLNVLKYAKFKLKYNKICLVTNGILLSYGKFLDNLINSGVDSFQISYSSLNEKKHNILSRTPNTFNHINKGIKNVIKRNKEVRINLVINKSNYRDLPNIVEHLIKLKISSITLAFMNPMGESVKNGKSTLAIQFTLVLPHIKRSFVVADKFKFNNLYIENFPLCIAKEHLSKLTDLWKPAENKEYYTSSKIKPTKCSKCVYYDNCEGVWKAYAVQFGINELVPSEGL